MFLSAQQQVHLTGPGPTSYQKQRSELYQLFKVRFQSMWKMKKMMGLAILEQCIFQHTGISEDADTFQRYASCQSKFFCPNQTCPLSVQPPQASKVTGTDTIFFRPLEFPYPTFTLLSSTLQFVLFSLMVKKESQFGMLSVFKLNAHTQRIVQVQFYQIHSS